MSILLFCVVLLPCFAGCRQKDDKEKHIDYAEKLKLDIKSETKKIFDPEIIRYIDGDTTWFRDKDDETIQARYLAVNTPESTGGVEPFGKTASEFTEDKLKNAVSVVLESDNDKRNYDDNGRLLVWVWYKTDEKQEYRNLNLEILQNGLAKASSSLNNRYGKTCMDAIMQAKREKLHIYSGKKDPEYHYGLPIEISLKDLRCSPRKYENKRVSFDADVTIADNNTIYVHDYDTETERYYAIQLYTGFYLSPDGHKILSPGNRVKIVGVVCKYNDVYQITDIRFDLFDTDDPKNIRLLEEGKEIVFTPFDYDRFQTESELMMSDAVSLENLLVTDIRTTQDGKSAGAMTMTCRNEKGKEIILRTNVLYEKKGSNYQKIEKERFEGKTIDVKGIIDCYNGDYQIRIFSYTDIKFK